MTSIHGAITLHNFVFHAFLPCGCVCSPRAGPYPRAAEPLHVHSIAHPHRRTLVRAPNPQLAIGQIGGHLKRGRASRAASAPARPWRWCPLYRWRPASDHGAHLPIGSQRSRRDLRQSTAPGRQSGGVVVPPGRCHLSVIRRLSGRLEGREADVGRESPSRSTSMSITGLDVAASRCLGRRGRRSRLRLHQDGRLSALWANAPIDVSMACASSLRFHHRIAGDLVDLKLGDGGVVYVFVTTSRGGGALCWQQSATDAHAASILAVIVIPPSPPPEALGASRRHLRRAFAWSATAR